MTLVRTLDCPSCGGPVRFRTRECGYCRAPLSWLGDLELDRGPAIEAHELAHVELPSPVSEVRARREPAGVTIELERGQLNSGLMRVPRRNGAVVIDGTCADPSGAFGVLFRVSASGHMRLGYAVTVRPGRRSVQVARLAWDDDRRSTQRVLDAWQTHPEVAPVGAANRLELRAADSVLQVLVNDRPIRTVHDASFGWGQAGWRALATDGPARLQLHRVGLFALAG